MVGTIIHVVNVERTREKKRTVLWIHLLSYLAGAAVLGGGLGALGGALRSLTAGAAQRSHVLVMTGVVGLLYGLREMGLLKVPAPKVMRQVPAKFRLKLPPKRVAFLYGFELGMGFTTYVTATTFYVVALWCLLVGSVGLGVLVMAAYGLGRAAPMWWLGWQPTSYEERSKIVDTLLPWKPMVHYANGLALGFVGASLLTAALLKP